MIGLPVIGLPVIGELGPVLNLLTDGVQIVDTSYRYLYLNDAAVGHARLPREALIGRTMSECYPGIEASPLFATLRRCMEERIALSIDDTFTYADGTSRRFEIRVEPVPSGISIVSVDVGARQQTRMIEAAPDAMVLVDARGDVAYVNTQALAMLGYEREDLVGRSVDLLVPDRARAAHAAHRRHFGEKPRLRGMGVGMVLSARRKDGSEVPVEVALSPLDDLVVVALRDISERKEVERRATLAHERLVSAIESFLDGFALFDDQDRLVLCNSAYRRLMPATWQGPAVGASFDRLVAAEAETLDLGEETAQSYVARRRSYHRGPSGSIDVRTRDGRSLRIVERATPEGGRVTTISDLTDDVKRELELRAAQEAAEVANAAKSEFLRSMSHELRTPMNAVLGFAQLIQRDRSLGERPKRLIEHVLSGGAHLLRLIDDVLDLARVEAGAVPLSLEPVAVRDVLDEVRATLLPSALRRNMSVVLPPPEGAEPLEVHADRTRLVQIVLNYLSNAIKYGRQGGEIVLTTVREPDRLRVVVKDDGPGIPSNKHERLFQAFYRAGQETGPVEGTGIGLALSRRLAHLMQGSVGFESAEGAGSSFWVELPVSLPRAPASPPLLPDAQSLATRGTERLSHVEATILYVEDNPANIAFMEELLADLPRTRLLTAPTGEIGVELARTHRPSVVILDINLPGISGFEALRALRAQKETENIPVLALSASAMDRDLRRAEEAGFARYLTKPVRVDELLAALSDHLPSRDPDA